MNKHALKKAISIAGGQGSLAKILGIKQSYVWNWLNRDNKVPAEYVLKIEEAVNGRVTRYELRPDIYPRST